MPSPNPRVVRQLSEASFLTGFLRDAALRGYFGLLSVVFCQPTVTPAHTIWTEHVRVVMKT